MFFAPTSRPAQRSSPSANPPCGGMPDLNACRSPSYGALAHGLDHPRDRIAHDGHHVEVVADEPELRVERGVLGEVPSRLVRLRAPDLAGLVDALEDADHRLLVELRALREERRPAEVVE